MEDSIPVYENSTFKGLDLYKRVALKYEEQIEKQEKEREQKNLEQEKRIAQLKDEVLEELLNKVDDK